MNAHKKEVQELKELWEFFQTATQKDSIEPGKYVYSILSSEGVLCDASLVNLFVKYIKHFDEARN